MPKGPSNRNDEGRKFYLFERCSGGILNLRFDSDILESFYSDCSFPRTRGRFRFGSIAEAIVCVIWLIYFCILRPYAWYSYAAGLIICGLISIVFFGLTFAAAFKKHCLWISGAYAFVSSLFVLLPYIPRVPPVSLTFNLSIVIQLIIFTYTMNPLRLWQQLLVCGPLSLLQIVFSASRFGAIGGSAMFIHVVAHLCVHSIGIVLHLMSQVWRRSTFLRLGYNALMRKELKKEQELRNDMIRSLMPGEVAQEVMRDVGNEDVASALDDTEGVVGATGGKKKSKHGTKGSKKTHMATDPSADEFGATGFGLSDEFDEEEEESEVHKKQSVASNQDWDGQNAPPGDVEAASASPRASVAPKTSGPPRAVTFRKFHVSQLENVSVLFADIVGFTKMSSNKSASHLVYLLNDLFGRFDSLCELTGCEKIATLGDCYYCVAGCPNPVQDHAERAVEMGRAMCLAIQQFDEDHSEEVNMRVGVHTGKVICGIVGTRRFKFDVWSNDVTLANEMESSGQAGKVHISEATYGFVKDIYEVSEGESVQDIRKFKVLIEFFNKEEQCFAIKHTQDEAMIKTYFIERRLDGKPVCALPPVEITPEPNNMQPTNGARGGTGGVSEVPASAGAAKESDGLNPSARPLLDGQQQTNNNNIPGTGDTQIPSSVSTALQEHRMSVDDKQASLKPTGRGSDVQMLEALKGLARVEDVFAFPPISRCTLNFYSNPVELSYRNLGLRRPKGQAAKHLSWSTPRIAPFINAVVETAILILIVIACLVTFPDSRVASNSPVFYIIAVIALLLQFLFLGLLIADMAAWAWNRTGSRQGNKTGCNWRRCAMRTYMVCFRWHMRNLIGAVLLVLPTAIVLSNFTGTYFNDVKSYTPAFIAYYRMLIGLMFSFMLFNYTLFTTFSSWTKTISACVGCAIAIILCLLPGSAYSPVIFDHYFNHWAFEPVVRRLTLVGTPLPAWAIPVLQDNFRWELLVVLLVTVALIGVLNRECDISFRLSFHRDYEALQAKQAIAQQKIQADWLLENIIPYYIMDDLRQHSKYSQHIDDAAVVFACISNFAEFYDEQYQGGQEMLRVLNEIFADFEHQLASIQYKDVEKIKTIGACFMAASGLNMQERRRNRRPDAHLFALMDFALDLIHTLDDFNRQMFNFQFEMKVGYNIGEVTAGVIGTTKLLYDIWGDTVNVASRMYSTGQKGRIQVTEAVAKRLESRYVFEYRGEVFVKGKGDMKTYLLSHRRND